jgi:four helix bundle protein
MSREGHFEVLEAWQTARALSRSVFELTAGEWFSGNFGLRSQMQKTSVSIMSNIAEGVRACTKISIQQYLAGAEGFAEKLRREIFAALDAGCLPEKQFQELQGQCSDCSAQIRGYLADLRSGPPPKRPMRLTQEALER